MFNLANEKRHDDDILQEEKKIDNYYFKLSDKVGQGNFSQVYRGVDQLSGKPVAIKVVKMASLTSKVAVQLLDNETSILKKLDHQNVIKCYEAFQSSNNCYIVTDFYDGGDLQKLINKNKLTTQKDFDKIVYGIYKGLVYLNQINIVHRDLKPANIFITNNGIPKIADFGFAVKCSEPFKDISIGSPIYMSPQGLLKKLYGPKTDVWSFGVILYEMIHNETPLSRCRQEKQLKQKVLQPPIFKDNISGQLKKLIQLSLVIDPMQRISIKQIGNTPYIKRLINFYEGVKPDIAKTDLYSTSNTNNRQVLDVVQQVKSYQDGLALLHYCRLIHKTSKQTPSPVFSQWLLTLCRNLQFIRIQGGDKQANQVLMQTIHNYNVQYKSQHKEHNILISYWEVIIECKKFISKIQKSINNSVLKTKQRNLQTLMNETEMLQKYVESNKLQTFTRCTQIQKYLQSLKHGHNDPSTQQQQAHNNKSQNNIINMGNQLTFYPYNK